MIWIHHWVRDYNLENLFHSLQWAILIHSLHQYINLLWEYSSIHQLHQRSLRRTVQTHTTVMLLHLGARTHTYAVFCRGDSIVERNQNLTDTEKIGIESSRGDSALSKMGSFGCSTPYCSLQIVHLQISWAERLWITELSFTSGSVWVCKVVQRSEQRPLEATNSFHFSATQIKLTMQLTVHC